MTMTDPIADMLTRLRNANSAYHDTVGMPYSKIKSHIAEILQQEGYIASWRVEDAEVGKNLVVLLKFGNQRERSDLHAVLQNQVSHRGDPPAGGLHRLLAGGRRRGR